MPILTPKNFTPPLKTLFNGHLQTIYPSFFRKIAGVNYHRERIDTEDGDFLDLDWAYSQPQQRSQQLVVVAHGLEGSSQRHYVKGMIKTLLGIGYDGLAINFRTCSGELNRLPRFYHHGDTPDLAYIIRYVAQQCPNYQTVVLVGFSMGGSMVLKYLGEGGSYVPSIVKKALAVSVPCDVASCSDELAKPNKWFYTKNFLLTLEKKLAAKAARMPEHISVRDFDKIVNFRQFDEAYTAPLHGFQNAADYYHKVSSRFYLEGIKVPALLISAKDDPFLTPLCFPTAIAQEHPYFYLETPNYGGHVGFTVRNQVLSYVEQRALEWFGQAN